MERPDVEKIVGLLADDALVAVLIDLDADSLVDCPPDFEELIEFALCGQRGFEEMDSKELQELVVDAFVDEDDPADVVELLDAHVKSGRHWVEKIKNSQIERLEKQNE